MCFNFLCRCWLLLWEMINELQIRLLKIAVLNQQLLFSPRTICNHLIMFCMKEKDILHWFRWMIKPDQHASFDSGCGRCYSRRAWVGHFLLLVGLPQASSVVTLQVLPPSRILSRLSYSQYTSCPFWEAAWWSALVPVLNRLFFCSVMLKKLKNFVPQLLKVTFDTNKIQHSYLWSILLSTRCFKHLTVPGWNPS